MKIKHHFKTTEERMIVNYTSVEEMADHYRDMFLAGWSIDLECTKLNTVVYWLKRDTETIARFEDEDEDF